MRPAALVALVALAVAPGACTCVDAASSSARAPEHETPAPAVDARTVQRRAAIRRESRELMPEALRGIELGLSTEAFRRLRPRAQPARATGREPDGKGWLEENLSSAARALYGFDAGDGRLVQLQVLSLVPSPDAIPPHLAAMQETYGTPTGIWDCPRTVELPPTRRFTWRRAHLAVQDVLLIYRGRVSITFYLAPSEEIHRSLRRARCVPIPAARAGELPVAEEIPGGLGGNGPAPAPGAPRVLRREGRIADEP